MLQQRAHIATNHTTHDGLHVSSVLTQTEVEISKPEDLVESRGDVGCNYRVSESSDISDLMESFVHTPCL